MPEWLAHRRYCYLDLIWLAAFWHALELGYWIAAIPGGAHRLDLSSSAISRPRSHEDRARNRGGPPEHRDRLLICRPRASARMMI
jgi:hypothetical protein